MHLRRKYGTVVTPQTRARLRKARKRKGYSMQYLGNLMGVTRATIHNWETGVYAPSTVTILQAWGQWVGLNIRVKINICIDELDPRPPAHLSRLGKRRVAGKRLRSKRGVFTKRPAPESDETATPQATEPGDEGGQSRLGGT